MANIFYSGRIPEALNEHVIKYAKALGKSKTRILIEALAQYTGFSLTTRREDSNFLSLPKLVEQLQQQMKDHQERLNTHAEEIKLIKNQFVDNLDNNVIKTKNSDISSHGNFFSNFEKAEGGSRSKDFTVQLTNSTWNKLREIAERQNISQADVIENLIDRNNIDVDEAIKILRQVLASKGKIIAVMKCRIRDALSCLDRTQNLKKH